MGKMTRTVALVAVGLLVLLLWSTDASAQATAEISGAVRDQSGAVLPGVTVTATQTDTGLRAPRSPMSGVVRAAESADRPVPSGGRVVGFPHRIAQTGIVLQVNSTAAVDAVLAAWRPCREVQVDGQRASWSTPGQSASVRSSRTSAFVELPLNGRQRHRADHAGRSQRCSREHRPLSTRRRDRPPSRWPAARLRHAAIRWMAPAMNNFDGRRRHARALSRRGAGVQRRNQRRRRHRAARRASAGEHGDQGRARTSLHGSAFEFLRDDALQCAPVLPSTPNRRSSAISSAARSAAR